MAAFFFCLRTLWWSVFIKPTDEHPFCFKQGAWVFARHFWFWLQFWSPSLKMVKQKKTLQFNDSLHVWVSTTAFTFATHSCLGTPVKVQNGNSKPESFCLGASARSHCHLIWEIILHCGTHALKLSYGKKEVCSCLVVLRPKSKCMIVGCTI